MAQSPAAVPKRYAPARPDRVSLGRIHSGPKPRPPKLYRIGEIIEYSGMSRQTIHNYTTMGLLPEDSWTSGGHRLYDESAFERLDLIAQLKAQNKSLQDIREYFEDNDAS
ncbi:MAG: MerR family transcriptional regulator [Planctomycetes bacterium]|nr:MerR family transcriptional regulator [Planctomycetota bacterium]